MTSEIVAEIVRSGFLEGVHHGSAVGLSADGAVAFAVGSPEAVMLPRSSNKPLQVVAMLRAGLPIDDELLALACASHSGEPFHLAGARQILAQAGVDESALQTPPDWPVDEGARIAYARQGYEPAPIAMNCSGKHAAMLLTCVVNGWPTDTYLEPTHPLQAFTRQVVGELAGEDVGYVAVDGCGAPLFGLTLVGLARAFRTLALADAGSPEAKVFTAVSTFPEWTSGTTRDEARLMRAIPGLMHKAGAEAVQAGALADGRAYAVKASDGNARVRPVLAAAALARLGVEHPLVQELSSLKLTGRGMTVGHVQATF